MLELLTSLPTVYPSVVSPMLYSLKTQVYSIYQLSLTINRYHNVIDMSAAETNGSGKVVSSAILEVNCVSAVVTKVKVFSSSARYL